MRQKLLLLGVLMLTTSSLNHCGKSEVIFKVTTFNLRFGAAEDGENDWSNRKSILIKCLQQNPPGILGTQEGLSFQLEELKKSLPGFDYFGMPRYYKVPIRNRPHEHLSGEHCAIFYDSSQFELDRSSTFWLSDTPNNPGSMTWGNDLPRIVTWGIFRHRSSQRAFAVFNTHYHWDEPFISNSTRLIQNKIGQIAGDLPVILLGDFNLVPESQAHTVFTSEPDSTERSVTFGDVWQELKKPEDTGKSFHAFEGIGKDRIDWILVTRPFKPIAVRRIEFAVDGHFPSDHFPIETTLCLPEN